jgi:hypothetical protein
VSEGDHVACWPMLSKKALILSVMSLEALLMIAASGVRRH